MNMPSARATEHEGDLWSQDMHNVWKKILIPEVPLLMLQTKKKYLHVKVGMSNGIMQKEDTVYTGNVSDYLHKEVKKKKTT